MLKSGVLGAAKWRENIRKSKDPGFAPRPGQTWKKNRCLRALGYTGPTLKLGQGSGFEIFSAIFFQIGFTGEQLQEFGLGGVEVVDLKLPRTSVGEKAGDGFEVSRVQPSWSEAERGSDTCRGTWTESCRETCVSGPRSSQLERMDGPLKVEELRTMKLFAQAWIIRLILHDMQLWKLKLHE